MDAPTTMTAEREIVLAARIRSGDVAARNELAAANEGLAVAFAERYGGRGLDLDDLMQEARIALLKAAEGFCPEAHGVRFAQYAGKCIRGALSRCVRNHGRLIRVPYQLQYAVRDFEAERARMIGEGVASPTFDEVADRLGVPPVRRDTLRAGVEAPEPEAVSEVDEPGSLDAGPHERLELAEQMTALEAAMRRLDSFERWVIERRYRLDDRAIRRARKAPGREADDGELRPYSRLSCECGVSPYLLRRVEAEAMDKLRSMLEDDAPDALVLAFRGRQAVPKSRRSSCA